MTFRQPPSGSNPHPRPGSGSPGLEELVEGIVRVWNSDSGFTDQTTARMGEIARRFARRLRSQGIGQLTGVDEIQCRTFIDAPTRTGVAPTDATRYFRRVTLRALFRTARNSGYPVGDPTLDIRLPPRSPRSTRPLESDEILLARTATFVSRNHNHRRAAAWALAEATATTSEIPLITADNFDDRDQPTTVELPGTRRVDARRVTLTEWGAAAVGRRLRHLGLSGRPIVYDGSGGEVARQAATCKLIGIVLAGAGLTDSDLRPESIRLWRAAIEYEQSGDLIAVARLLGNRSLDRTAEALDIDWRRP